MITRRKFISTCGTIVCLSCFGSIFKLAAQNTSTQENTNKDEAFALQWITELLDSLDAEHLTDSQLRNIVKSASQAHFDLLDVPAMVKDYVGNPEKFIEFLQNSWGWVITDNKSEHKLIVDENKPVCVCPLLKNSADKLYPALCYCSEGFAEKMFSAVYMHPVYVTVAASIQRGNPTCIYHIDYHE